MKHLLIVIVGSALLTPTYVHAGPARGLAWLKQCALSMIGKGPQAPSPHTEAPTFPVPDVLAPASIAEIVAAAAPVEEAPTPEAVSMVTPATPPIEAPEVETAAEISEPEIASESAPQSVDEFLRRPLPLEVPMEVGSVAVTHVHTFADLLAATPEMFRFHRLNLFGAEHDFRSLNPETSVETAALVLDYVHSLDPKVIDSMIDYLATNYRNIPRTWEIAMAAEREHLKRLKFLTEDPRISQIFNCLNMCRNLERALAVLRLWNPSYAASVGVRLLQVVEFNDEDRFLSDLGINLTKLTGYALAEAHGPDLLPGDADLFLATISRDQNAFSSFINFPGVPKMMGRLFENLLRNTYHLPDEDLLLPPILDWMQVAHSRGGKTRNMTQFTLDYLNATDSDRIEQFRRASLAAVGR